MRTIRSRRGRDLDQAELAFNGPREHTLPCVIPELLAASG